MTVAYIVDFQPTANVFIRGRPAVNHVNESLWGVRGVKKIRLLTTSEPDYVLPEGVDNIELKKFPAVGNLGPSWQHVIRHLMAQEGVRKEKLVVVVNASTPFLTTEAIESCLDRVASRGKNTPNGAITARLLEDVVLPAAVSGMEPQRAQQHQIVVGAYVFRPAALLTGQLLPCRTAFVVIGFAEALNMQHPDERSAALALSHLGKV